MTGSDQAGDAARWHPAEDSDGVLSEAELVAAAVVACPDVAAMSAGPLGQYRSYLPGRSVPGVRIDDDHLIINVVARYGPALPELGSQLTAAITPILHGRRVTVTIDDIQVPGHEDPAADTNNTG